MSSCCDGIAERRCDRMWLVSMRNLNLHCQHLESLGIKKPIHALDSYEGFDRGELERERSRGLTDAPDDSFTSTSYSYVVRKLERLGYDDTIFPVQGLFRDTLPLLAAETRYSFALVDCDLQDSVSYCADTLWPRMVPGAVVAFDDYASDEFRGARLAVDAFVSGQTDDISSHGMLNRNYSPTLSMARPARAI